MLFAVTCFPTCFYASTCWETFWQHVSAWNFDLKPFKTFFSYFFQLAQECDDEIEKRKRTEEMLRISQQIDFLPEIEWIPILKSNRYLVLQTKVQHFMFRDKAMRKLGLQLYLFDDILLITKRSSNRPMK